MTKSTIPAATNAAGGATTTTSSAYGRFKSKTTNKQSPFMQSLQRRLILRQRQERSRLHVLPTRQNVTNNQPLETETPIYSHARITALSLYETDHDNYSGDDNVNVNDIVNDVNIDVDSNTRLHPLPMVLGRKNMATWWWNACVNARYDCCPPRHKKKLRAHSFCADRCRSLAQQVHCLSKDMIHISTTGHVRIVAKHNSNLIHIIQPQQPPQSQQQNNEKNKDNDKHIPTAQNINVSIGLQGDTPWMNFRVQILPDTTSTFSSSLVGGHQDQGTTIITKKRKTTTVKEGSPSSPLCKKQKGLDESNNNNNNNTRNNQSHDDDEEEQSSAAESSPRSSTRWIFPPTEAAIQIRRARADARKQSVRRSLMFALSENEKSNSNDPKKFSEKSLFQQQAELPRKATNREKENTPDTPPSPPKHQHEKDPHKVTTPRRRNYKSSKSYHPPSLTPLTPTTLPEQDQQSQHRDIHNNSCSAPTGDAASHDAHSGTKKKNSSVSNRHLLADYQKTMDASQFEQSQPLDDDLGSHDQDTSGSVVGRNNGQNEVTTTNKIQTLSTLSDQSPDYIDHGDSNNSNEYSSALQIGGQTNSFQSQPPQRATNYNASTSAMQQDSKGEMIHLLLGLKKQQQQQQQQQYNKIMKSITESDNANARDGLTTHDSIERSKPSTTREDQLVVDRGSKAGYGREDPPSVDGSGRIHSGTAAEDGQGNVVCAEPTTNGSLSSRAAILSQGLIHSQQYAVYSQESDFKGADIEQRMKERQRAPNKDRNSLSRIPQYCQQDSQSTANSGSHSTDPQKAQSQLILSQMDDKNTQYSPEVESQHKKAAVFPSISFQNLALGTGTESSKSSIQEEDEEYEGQQSQQLPSSQAAEGRSDSNDMSEICSQEQPRRNYTLSQQINSAEGGCNSSSGSIFRVGSQPDPAAAMGKVGNRHHLSVSKCASTDSGEGSEASSVLSLPCCDKRLSTQTSLKVLDYELSPYQSIDASSLDNRGKQKQEHQGPLRFWRDLQRNTSSTRSKAARALISMVVDKNEMNSPTAPFWLPSLLDDIL